MADLLSAVSVGSNLLGSVFSAFGASDREKAIKKATKKAQRRIGEFTDDFTGQSAENKANKDQILQNSGDVFDRLGGFIFGEGETLSNLRKSQENFSEAAAGNFENFNQETQALVSSALASTYGGPSGSFENLSAKNLFDFRSRGLQNALSATNTFQSLGSGLISTEFGIMDQDFERRLGLGQYNVEQQNALAMQRAGVEGSTEAAIGAGLSQLGQGFDAFGTRQRLDGIATSNNLLTNSRAGFFDAQAASLGNYSPSQLAFGPPSTPAVPQAYRPPVDYFTGASTYGVLPQFESAPPARSSFPVSGVGGARIAEAIASSNPSDIPNWTVLPPVGTQ